jgi:hypothetical protein
MKTLWLFDLDETLFDNKHREHHVQKEVPDWDAFHAFDEMVKDTPMPWTAELWTNGKFRYGAHGFLTARDHRCADATKHCLVTHGFVGEEPPLMFATGFGVGAAFMQLLRTEPVLFMNTPKRESGVHFKALTLLMLLEADLELQIVFCEDQQRIINALRGLNHPRLAVLDVNDGAFETLIHYYGVFANEGRAWIP